MLIYIILALAVIVIVSFIYSIFPERDYAAEQKASKEKQEAARLRVEEEEKQKRIAEKRLLKEKKKLTKQETEVQPKSTGPSNEVEFHDSTRHPLFWKQMKYHGGEVLGGGFSGDNLVISVSRDRTLRYLDLNHIELAPRRKNLELDHYTCFNISGDGELAVASTHYSKELHVYRKPFSDIVCTIPSNQSREVASAVITKSNFVICYSRDIKDLNVHVFHTDGKTATLVESIDIKQVQNLVLQSSSCGRWLGVGSLIGDVKIFYLDPKNKKVPKAMMLRAPKVSGLCFSLDGKQAITCSSSTGKVTLWNIDVQWQQSEDAKIIWSIVVESDGNHMFGPCAINCRDIIAVISSNDCVLLSARDGVIIDRIQCICVGGVSALAWSPDGRRLATFGVDKKIRLWQCPNVSD